MHAMRELPVAPIRRSPTILPVAPNQWHLAPSRAAQEGRLAIVTDVERGMRWTRWCRQTSDNKADGEGVWSWRPLAGAKPAGDDQKVTVTEKSWTPGRARMKPLNYRAGNAGSFRRTCGDYARVLFPFAREAAGAPGIRHSLRPLSF